MKSILLNNSINLACNFHNLDLFLESNEWMF